MKAAAERHARIHLDNELAISRLVVLPARLYDYALADLRRSEVLLPFVEPLAVVACSRCLISYVRSRIRLQRIEQSFRLVQLLLPLFIILKVERDSYRVSSGLCFLGCTRDLFVYIIVLVQLAMLCDVDRVHRIVDLHGIKARLQKRSLDRLRLIAFCRYNQFCILHTSLTPMRVSCRFNCTTNNKLHSIFRSVWLLFGNLCVFLSLKILPFDCIIWL